MTSWRMCSVGSCVKSQRVMPPRLSDRTKIRRGTARPDRLTRRPPTLAASVPACRPDLPPAVQANHRRLAALLEPLRTLTAADALVLERGARTMTEVDRLSATLEKDPAGKHAATDAPEDHGGDSAGRCPIVRPDR